MHPVNTDGLVSYEDIKLAMSYYVESDETPSMRSPDSVDEDNGDGPAFEYRSVTIEQTGDPREMLEASLPGFPDPMPCYVRCCPYTDHRTIPP